jgi:hypothetical protein
MDTKAVIKSQYLAALAMLRQAVERCPEALWDDHTYRNRFWHVAYHALFYTHLYLQDTLEDFRAWVLHRKEHNYLGAVPWPPHHTPVIGEPYTRDEILAYCTICKQQVAERVDALDLEAGSGFDWLPFCKLELQFYNIRHIQHHTGELMERLGTHAGVDVDWVGSRAQAQ